MQELCHWFELHGMWLHHRNKVKTGPVPTMSNTAYHYFRGLVAGMMESFSIKAGAEAACLNVKVSPQTEDVYAWLIGTHFANKKRKNDKKLYLSRIVSIWEIDPGMDKVPDDALNPAERDILFSQARTLLPGIHLATTDPEAWDQRAHQALETLSKRGFSAELLNSLIAQSEAFFRYELGSKGSAAWAYASVPAHQVTGHDELDPARAHFQAEAAEPAPSLVDMHEGLLDFAQHSPLLPLNDDLTRAWKDFSMHADDLPALGFTEIECKISWQILHPCFTKSQKQVSARWKANRERIEKTLSNAENKDRRAWPQHLRRHFCYSPTTAEVEAALRRVPLLWVGGRLRASSTRITRLLWAALAEGEHDACMRLMAYSQGLAESAAPPVIRQVSGKLDRFVHSELAEMGVIDTAEPVGLKQHVKKCDRLLRRAVADSFLQEFREDSAKFAEKLSHALFRHLKAI
ncbi:MAG: hypothetical protein ACO1TE_24355 [Prosthecobacter sp.]